MPTINPNTEGSNAGNQQNFHISEGIRRIQTELRLISSNPDPINTSANTSFVPTLNRSTERHARNQQEGLCSAAESIVPAHRIQVQYSYQPPPINLSANESFVPNVYNIRGSNGIQQAQCTAAACVVSTPRPGPGPSSYNPHSTNFSVNESYETPFTRFRDNYYGYQPALCTSTPSALNPYIQSQSTTSSPIIHPYRRQSSLRTPQYLSTDRVDLETTSSVNSENDLSTDSVVFEGWETTSSVSSEDDLSTDSVVFEGLETTSSVNCEDGIVRVTYEDSRMKEATLVLLKNFKDSYLNKIDTDVTIKIKNKEFAAHKLVLRSRSEVFASMFQHDLSENKTGIIEITDCDPDSFEDFLLFLYTADLNIVTTENVVGLCRTSDKYGIKELFQQCIECMIRELSVDTFCDYFQIATLYNESDLLTAVTNFFMKNAKNIFLTTKWLDFLDEHHSLCNELLIKYSNAR